MKKLWSKYTFTLFMLLILCVSILFSYQLDSAKVVNAVASPENFPYRLLIALFSGMFAHWLRNYKRGSITVNILTYILDSVGKTITAVIAALSQLIATYSLSPESYAGGIVAWWSVFLMGYAADSAFNGTKIDTPTKPVE